MNSIKKHSLIKFCIFIGIVFHPFTNKLNAASSWCENTKNAIRHASCHEFETGPEYKSDKERCEACVTGCGIGITGTHQCNWYSGEDQFKCLRIPNTEKEEETHISTKAICEQEDARSSTSIEPYVYHFDRNKLLVAMNNDGQNGVRQWARFQHLDIEIYGIRDRKEYRLIQKHFRKENVCGAASFGDLSETDDSDYVITLINSEEFITAVFLSIDSEYTPIKYSLKGKIDYFCSQFNKELPVRRSTHAILLATFAFLKKLIPAPHLNSKSLEWSLEAESSQNNTNLKIFKDLGFVIDEDKNNRSSLILNNNKVPIKAPTLSILRNIKLKRLKHFLAPI